MSNLLRVHKYTEPNKIGIIVGYAGSPPQAVVVWDDAHGSLDSVPVNWLVLDTGKPERGLPSAAPADWPHANPAVNEALCNHLNGVPQSPMSNVSRDIADVAFGIPGILLEARIHDALLEAGLQQRAQNDVVAELTRAGLKIVEAK